MGDGSWRSTDAGRALGALKRIIQALADAELEFNDAALVALDQFMRVTTADAAALAIPDENGQPIVVARRNLRSARQLSMTVLRQALTTEHPEAMITRPPDSESVAGAFITSVLCVPVRRRGEAIAAIYLDRRGPGTKPFDQIAIDMAVCFAGALAPTLALIRRTEIDRSLRQRAEAEAEEAKRVSAHLLGFWRFADMSTYNEAFARVLELAERAARYDVDVLLLGETGTGKEYIARALHQSSPRSIGRFVAVNCAALPESVLENELFGHEAGSFTGANERFRGKFEQAQRGTLYLDEIGEIPLAVQPKLLRVIEQKRIVRLGGSEEIPVDVRIIASTNRDLDRDVRLGRFREDLYFRLNKMPIVLPPLRDRVEDIPHLANHFLKIECGIIRRNDLFGFDPSAIRHLAEYDWPGNIRELRNIVGRCCVQAEGPYIHKDDVLRCLPMRGPIRRKSFYRPGVALRELVRQAEITIIREILEHGGSISAAAKLLGVRRQALQQRCRILGVDPSDFTNLSMD